MHCALLRGTKKKERKYLQNRAPVISRGPIFAVKQALEAGKSVETFCYADIFCHMEIPIFTYALLDMGVSPPPAPPAPPAPPPPPLPLADTMQ
jgi:hypothetical protein